MPRTIALRVSAELEQKLKACAAAAETSVSAFVRAAVERAIENEPSTRRRPGELAKNLVGKYASGRGDLAEEHSRILKEKLRAKHTG